MDVQYDLKSSFFTSSLNLLKVRINEFDRIYNALSSFNMTQFLKITGQFRTLEKVILEHLEKHLVANELIDALQYAYCAKHSTETAPLKVQNVVLIMLDLSAALINTIDHALLLSRLPGLGLTYPIDYTE